MSNMFDNEMSWMFIGGAILGCVAVHSCNRTDQEQQRTVQVEIRAKADVELARMAYSNSVPRAADQPEAGK